MVKGEEEHQFICSYPGLYRAHPFAVFPQGKGQRSFLVSHAPCCSPTPNHCSQITEAWVQRGFFPPSLFWSLSWQAATKQSLIRSLGDARESATKCHLLDQVAPGPIPSDTDASLHLFGSLCLHVPFPIPPPAHCQICQRTKVTNAARGTWTWAKNKTFQVATVSITILKFQGGLRYLLGPICDWDPMAMAPPCPWKKSWWINSLKTSTGSQQQRLQLAAPTWTLVTLEDFIIIL